MLIKLVDELEKNEIWLMERILKYATDHDYTRFTSTLMEAWHASIHGLNKSIAEYAKVDQLPINSDFDGNVDDASTAFGKLEAIKHRDRGISITLFLGLFKYYRQTYLDFIDEVYCEDQKLYSEFIGTFFDKVEISFIDEWMAEGEDNYREALLKENVRLANEKNKFLTIFESLYEPVYVVNEKGEVVNANHQAALLHNKNMMPGSNYYSDESVLLPERFKPLVDEALLSEEEVFSKTLEYDENGQYFCYELLFTKLLDVSSKYKGLCVIVNDNSNLKRAEKKLIYLNKDLQSQVKKETQKRLKNERMLIEQKKAADMGNMVNAIAHQWKQPVNTLSLQIQFLFQALHDGMTYEELSEYEDKMNGLLEYMSKTIDDFREFMTPDKKKVFFSVKKAVFDSLSILDAQLNNNSIECETCFDESQCSAYGSSGELKQVLLNLIVNSKEAFDTGDFAEKKVKISVSQNNEEVIITVQDNAGGIPDKILRKIFYPYFTTKSKGTGIGLYMSKIIIEDGFSGNLKIENAEDGALTTITLPKQKDE